MREIAEVIVGAGCDRLILSCGHEIVRSHKPRWGKRTRCHSCRVWHREDAA
jgi:hypothetical protein